MGRILIAEDEPKVRDFVRQALEQAGMTVDAVVSYAELIACLEVNPYDALVLDRLLKEYDTLRGLGELRRRFPSLKILFLSALSEVEERVRGLGAGADDYLGKPFHVSELLARVRALLRRPSGSAGPLKERVLTYDDLKIDLERQKVWRGDRAIDLTGKEFRLLALLARSPGQVFSKAHILNMVWDLNHFPESNVVEVTMANLRAKLDPEGKGLIGSRRGVGYWLGDA